MGVANHQEDLLSRIRDLERQMKEMRRSTLSGAVISNGALEVRNPTTGNVIMRAGVWDYGGGPVPGFALFREDGSTQFWAFDTATGSGYLTIYDEQQNEIIKPDTVAGQGLAAPYLQDQATPWSRVANPPETTTSGSFTPLWRAHRIKQHPRVRVQVVIKTGADTVGEVRLAVNSSAVSDVLQVPIGTFAYFGLWATISGAHMSDIYLDVEARRVSGTGTVGVETVAVHGVAS